jgi:hypothetical protein
METPCPVGRAAFLDRSETTWLSRGGLDWIAAAPQKARNVQENIGRVELVEPGHDNCIITASINASG